MPALKQIAQGWFLFIKASPGNRVRMQRRLDICDTCPSKVQTTGTGRILTNAIGNNPENTFSCNECHCPLGALASVPQPACKLGKWNHIK